MNKSLIFLTFILSNLPTQWFRPSSPFSSISFKIFVQLSVDIFLFEFSKKIKPCLESFYQGIPDDDLATCEEDGVIGTAAGIVGNIQANEAIKYILGVGYCLNGKILIINLLNLEFRICDLI